MANDDDGAQDQGEVMVPRCPDCNGRVHGDKLICYRYFQQAIESGAPSAYGDMNEDEFSTADEGDDGMNLGGFVVSDDEANVDVEREVVEEEDGMVTDSDGGDEFAEDSSLKREDSIPPSASEDYREPSIKSEASSSPVGGPSGNRRPRTRASRQLHSEAHSDVEIPDFEMANTKNRRPRASRPRRDPQARAPTIADAREKYLETLRAEFVSSAKIDKAMELLREIGPRKKTLIFSQWTSFLDLLEIPIRNAGYQYTRYDGTMKPAERDDAVKAFQENPRVKIMLVSLKAGNVGLNLTAAQCVFIMEPDLSESYPPSFPLVPSTSEKKTRAPALVAHKADIVP